MIDVFDDHAVFLFEICNDSPRATLFLAHTNIHLLVRVWCFENRKNKKTLFQNVTCEYSFILWICFAFITQLLFMIWSYKKFYLYLSRLIMFTFCNIAEIVSLQTECICVPHVCCCYRCCKFQLWFFYFFTFIWLDNSSAGAINYLYC